MSDLYPDDPCGYLVARLLTQIYVEGDRAGFRLREARIDLTPVRVISNVYWPRWARPVDTNTIHLDELFEQSIKAVIGKRVASFHNIDHCILAAGMLVSTAFKRGIHYDPDKGPRPRRLLLLIRRLQGIACWLQVANKYDGPLLHGSLIPLAEVVQEFEETVPETAEGCNAALDAEEALAVLERPTRPAGAS